MLSSTRLLIKWFLTKETCILAGRSSKEQNMCNKRYTIKSNTIQNDQKGTYTYIYIFAQVSGVCFHLLGRRVLQLFSEVLEAGQNF